MGTPDNPTVFIQFYDEDYTRWRELITRCKSFTVKDAGILKIPQATVTFREPPVLPNKGQRLRIQVDTLGESGKLIFYGKISEIGTNPIPATAKKYHTIVAYGIEKRFKNDTITWKYATEQAAHGELWTYKNMIEDFLVLPDSGYDTNITLDTDNQEILNGVEKGCDFSRATLLNALRKISETIFYDGYIYIDPSDKAQLKYKKLGTLWADPATTLEDPFIGKPELTESIDEIQNYILVWGGADRGYPTDGDKFTERVIAKYAPSIWEALDGETIEDSKSDPADLKNFNTVTSANSSNLTDSTKSWTTNEWKGYNVFIKNGKGAGQLRVIFSNTETRLTLDSVWTTIPDNTSKYQIFMGHNMVGEDVVRSQLSRYTVGITNPTIGHHVRFHIDRTGKTSLDLQDRFFYINFAAYVQVTSGADFPIAILINLTDVNNDVIKRGSTKYPPVSPYRIMRSRMPNWLNDRATISVETLPIGTKIKTKASMSSWQYVGDSTSFDATQVKYVELHTSAGSSILWIDRFYFGGGLKIDPFQNPQYYPSPAVNGAIFDLNSIGEPNNYGVRLYHHTDRDISSFEEAVLEGSRILSILKQPIKTVTVVKKGLEWLRPHQNITLNSASLGISNETWRPMELMWKWQSNYPVYCKLRLVEQYAKIAPVFTPSGEIPATTSMPTWEGWFGQDWGKPTRI